MDQKIETKAAAARVYNILSSLLRKATLQEEQVKTLTVERINYTKGLGFLAKLGEFLRVSLFRKAQTTDTKRQDLEIRLREVTVCLA